MIRWIRAWFHRWIANEPDPKAIMSRPVYSFTGYCERTQVKAIKKTQAEHRKKFRTAPSEKPKATVVPIRSKQA